MPPKHHTIALCGLAGTGKDTVADLLCTHAGFTRMAFADALRAEAATAFGLPLGAFTDRATKDTPNPALALCRGPVPFRNAVAVAYGSDQGFGPLDAFFSTPRTPRQILQWWGTEYRRAQEPDYWVTQVAARAHHARNRLGVSRIVITDLRFPNEAAWLRHQPGQRIWQVTRPGIDSTGASGEGAHPSASTGSQFAPDAILNNRHTIAHLQGLVLAEFWAAEYGVQRNRISVAEDAT